MAIRQMFFITILNIEDDVKSESDIATWAAELIKAGETASNKLVGVHETTQDVPVVRSDGFRPVNLIHKGS